MNAAQLKSQQRTSIWYNTVFAMAFFGCLGGLLAWGTGELIQLKPLTRPSISQNSTDAQEQWDAILRVQRRYNAGIDQNQCRISAPSACKNSRPHNPYFQHPPQPNFSTDQKTYEIENIHSNYETQAFIAKVLAYGLIGMIIAFCLAAAEPLIDRNFHGVSVNGAVGAMLGLFGGVIVSLFVDRLYSRPGRYRFRRTQHQQQIIANAIKYGVVGSLPPHRPRPAHAQHRKSSLSACSVVLSVVSRRAPLRPRRQSHRQRNARPRHRDCRHRPRRRPATGLIENAAKTGWLKVVAGFIAGKQFILYRATTYIGSSSRLPHLPLQRPRHRPPPRRRPHRPRRLRSRRPPPRRAHFVNGKPVSRDRLRTGDQIQVGSTVFTFQEKVKAA